MRAVARIKLRGGGKKPEPYQRPNEYRERQVA